MRCFLALNGICDLDLKEIEADLFVGVDGGTDHLIKAGVIPNLVIGDMDSISSPVKGSEILEFPTEKDEIDAELAIEECFKRGVENVLVGCWMGERIDMEYALLSLISRYPSLSVKLISKKLDVFYVEGRKRLEAKIGEKWSILSVGGDVVLTLEGFKYNTRSRVMTVKKPYGVSNVALSEKVIVDVEKGGVLVFRWREEPL